MTKSEQPKMGLKSTYRDATRKPNAQISLDEAHESIMVQLKKFVDMMAGAVLSNKKSIILGMAKNECEKYIEALDNISEGLQAEYRRKYKEEASDSIWDLIDEAYLHKDQEGTFTSEESMQEDIRGRTASANIESEGMSASAATSNITTDSSSYYSGLSKTYTSSTQSGKDTVHHDVKPVREQIDKAPIIEQPETGPYTKEQLERFVKLVYDCLDPTYVPCDETLVGIAEHRRLYLASAQGINARKPFVEGDQAVYEYHKPYLFHCKNLVRTLIQNNQINPEKYMCMAALEIATCLYISIIVEGYESKKMTVERKIHGIRHWISRIPRSKTEVELLTLLVHKMMDELQSRDVGQADEHNMPVTDNQEDDDGDGGEYQADDAQQFRGLYPKPKSGRGASQQAKRLGNCRHNN
jgi:hypothetical protein